MSKPLLIGIGGIGGRKYSAGLKTVGAMAEKLGWEFRYYAWTQGRQAGNEARSASGPVAVIWHSAGKAGSDNFADAFGRKIERGFALDSWLPNQQAHELFIRVYSIKAGRVGRFHVRGSNVIAKINYPDETHTTLDDEPKLHAFVIARLQELIGAGDEPGPDTKEPDMQPQPKPPRGRLRYDRKTYFDYVRRDLFKGKMTQQQVDGQNQLLDIWETHYSDWHLEELAYDLATAFHETGATMTPVMEGGDRAYFDRYEFDERLGNTQSGDGYKYRGAGHVQNTGRRNARVATQKLNEHFDLGIDLVANPDDRLRHDVSAHSLFLGNHEGWWTGKRLPNYAGYGNWNMKGARSVVNGSDLWEKIGGYAERFKSALQAAAKPLPVPTRPDPAENAPVPPKNGPVAIPGDDVGALTLQQLQIIVQQNSLLLQELIKLARPMITVEPKTIEAMPEKNVPKTETKENEDEPMTQSKFFLKSRGILGIILAGIGFLQPAAKPITDVLMPGDAAAFDPEVFTQVSETLKQTVETGHMIIGTIGLLISAWGRMDAKSKLTFNLKDVSPKTELEK